MMRLAFFLKLEAKVRHKWAAHGFSAVEKQQAGQGKSW